MAVQHRQRPLGCILQPREGRAFGTVRETIEAIQAELVAELVGLDADVDKLVRRRAEIVAELRRCRDALGGVGSRIFRRFPLPAEADAVPEWTHLLAGRELRDVLVAILRSAERQLTLSELHRALLARGYNVNGRPPHALSNALRRAVANGDARRIRPGVYAAMPSGS